MAFVRFNWFPPQRPRSWLRLGVVLAGVGAVLAVALVLTGLRGLPSAQPAPAPGPMSGTPGASGPATTAAAEVALPVLPPDPGLPVIDYGPAPAGFAADPDPLSTSRLAEGLHPTGRVGLYDAPGGRARAYLEPTIRGVPVTTPIVARRSGWAGVLLPSANRSVAWVPPGSWTTVALNDQLIVVRPTHQLMWLRDDILVRTWPVTLGASVTPTPLGRTFILGRGTLPGYVYGDTDVFALGAVPDDVGAVPAGLRGAHIGLHTWYNDDTLGQNATDGCIRLTRTGQRELLTEIEPGTELLVVDTFSGPTSAPTAAPPG